VLPWYGNGLHLYLCLLWSAIRPQLWFVSNKKDDCDVFLALVIQLSLFNDFLEAIGHRKVEWRRLYHLVS